MKKYRLLSHTADVRLYIEGSDLEELFFAAIDGMNEIIKKGACQEERLLSVKKEIAISAMDATVLLIDFMSEVLTLTHEERAIFCKVKFSELGKQSLNAVLEGCQQDEFDVDVKAATYHEADVKKNERGNWETVVIFDI
jgi:SHS2 domain-containing protein